jgi:hypothetical protein
MLQSADRLRDLVTSPTNFQTRCQRIRLLGKLPGIDFPQLKNVLPRTIPMSRAAGRRG